MHYRIFLTVFPITALAALLLVLTGCSAGPAPRAVAEPEETLTESWPAPVGQVDLQRLPQAPEAALDVALVTFDPGLPEEQAGLSRRGIFPDIRRAEARYLPVLLREQLQQSNAWGAVRVLPEPQQASELQLQGRILHSDGQFLVLEIRAQDASGRLWLEQVYVDETSEEDYPVVAGEDPFADLHRRIANDLLEFQRGLGPAELQRIRQTALLRHASALAPEAFADFLQKDQAGRYQLLRLPAKGDPMLARVERLRNQEYLFIDTVDEQYVDLYREMAPTYNLWRQYGREQALYRDDYQRRLARRDSAGARGTYAAMEQTYNAFKWSKIQQQDLEELARGFNNEIQPTVLDVSGTVFRLSGSLESQYDEWRQILREIFALESGLD
ncbi:hypothetical protein [Kineobactrum salinum]|uniref:Uncharacterized protein n=1 Tax=Kineobactrum salinum TaxID=2708301 RepID=A0A6C0U5Q2_9GAMM|nr:hypothetical protein [Kineobactrum salinum]QIB67268.1 hypothetical protein G3T16_19555 [Kineobactrum salinum]